LFSSSYSQNLGSLPLHSHDHFHLGFQLQITLPIQIKAAPFSSLFHTAAITSTPHNSNPCSTTSLAINHNNHLLPKSQSQSIQAFIQFSHGSPSLSPTIDQFSTTAPIPNPQPFTILTQSPIPIHINHAQPVAFTCNHNQQQLKLSKTTHQDCNSITCKS
jgi:hypothetical protein